MAASAVHAAYTGDAASTEVPVFLASFSQDILLIFLNMFLGHHSICKSTLQGTASLHQVRVAQEKTTVSLR